MLLSSKSFPEIIYEISTISKQYDFIEHHANY